MPAPPPPPLRNTHTHTHTHTHSRVGQQPVDICLGQHRMALACLRWGSVGFGVRARGVLGFQGNTKLGPSTPFEIGIYPRPAVIRGFGGTKATRGTGGLPRTVSSPRRFRPQNLAEKERDWVICWVRWTVWTAVLEGLRSGPPVCFLLRGAFCCPSLETSVHHRPCPEFAEVSSVTPRHPQAPLGTDPPRYLPTMCLSWVPGG